MKLMLSPQVFPEGPVLLLLALVVLLMMAAIPMMMALIPSHLTMSKLFCTAGLQLAAAGGCCTSTRCLG
jgi:hypothetical protein